MLALFVSIGLVIAAPAAAHLIETSRNPVASAGPTQGVSAQAASITGTVVDTTGASVPRAMVRLLNADGTERGRTLTDARGHFGFDEAACAGCTLDVALTGFQNVAMGVTVNSPATITLPVQGVEESVLVSPTNTEAPSIQTGTTTTVITAEDLEHRQSLLVADVLRVVPGLTVVRTGGLGSLTSVFVRGGESNYTKVLLDGIPLNDPGGFFNFGTLTTDHLERIEIVRGPQSALYGSDAMAGVIQLFTPSADQLTEPVRVEGSFEGGSFSTWRGRAGLAGRAGTWTYRVEGARLETDNQEPHNEFEQTSGLLNVGGQAGERTRLRFIVRGASGQVGTPGQTAFGRPDLDAVGDRRDWVAGGSARMLMNRRWEQRFSYAFANSRQISTNLVADPPYTPSFEGSVSPFEFFDFLYDSADDLDRHHVGYQSDYRLGSIATGAGEHILTGAFEWEHEAGTLDDRLTPGDPVEASRDNFGWTIQHQMLWPRVFVTWSARVENNDSFGTAFVPRAVVAYLLREGEGTFGTTKLKASAGLGIKEPSLVQSFSPSPSFEGNPDLDPERSRGLEAGVEQRALDGGLKVELNVFDNHYRDIIATETLSFVPFRARFFNIGESRARGLEVIVEARSSTGVRAAGSYTLLDSEITESTSEFSPVLREGQPLFRRPRHSGSITASWDLKRLTLATAGIFVGERTDSDFSALEPPLVENDGYAKWDASASFRITPDIVWFGVVENLFDKDYMEPLGYPALGRSARTGVSFGL